MLMALLRAQKAQTLLDAGAFSMRHFEHKEYMEAYVARGSGRGDAGDDPGAEEAEFERVSRQDPSVRKAPQRASSSTSVRRRGTSS